MERVMKINNAVSKQIPQSMLHPNFSVLPKGTTKNLDNSSDPI